MYYVFVIKGMYNCHSSSVFLLLEWFSQTLRMSNEDRYLFCMQCYCEPTVIARLSVLSQSGLLARFPYGFFPTRQCYCAKDKSWTLQMIQRQMLDFDTQKRGFSNLLSFLLCLLSLPLPKRDVKYLVRTAKSSLSLRRDIYCIQYFHLISFFLSSGGLNRIELMQSSKTVCSTRRFNSRQ